MDVSELRKLEVDLGAGAVAALADVRAVVQKGALKIKNQLREEAGGVVHAPALPAMINYETKIGPTYVEAEIGVRTGPKGSPFATGGLAFFYYGNSKVGPQLPDPMLALRKEAAVVEDYAVKIAAKALL
jgi:hypothetical protein